MTAAVAALSEDDDESGDGVDDGVLDSTVSS